MSSSLEKCEKAIQYKFKDRKLLKRALTHASLRDQDGVCNERLEFLGDAILGLVISEFLFHTFQDFDEGDLSLIKSTVVSRSTLAKQAEEISLQNFFSYAGGKNDRKSKQGKKLPSSVLANVFEAIIGAIYLDSGLPEAQEFIVSNLRNEIEAVIKNPYQQNYKTLLQFIAQKYLGTTPAYKVWKIDQSKKDKLFAACAIIGERKFIAAEGVNKKEAEQLAAHSALQILSLEDPVIAEYIERTLGTEDNYSPEAPISKMSNLFQNSKSLLQHVTQKYRLSPPRYKRVQIEVQDEKKYFHIAVSLQGRLFPSAKATRVKEAERLAARKALEVLGEEYYQGSLAHELTWGHSPTPPPPSWPLQDFW